MRHMKAQLWLGKQLERVNPYREQLWGCVTLPSACTAVGPHR
jgi:hypothetical protein